MGEPSISMVRCGFCHGQFDAEGLCACDDGFGDERDCQTCGGDGYVPGSELHDPDWYDDDELCPCPNCGGSGLAADQTYW